MASDSTSTEAISQGGEFDAECIACGFDNVFLAQGGEKAGEEVRLQCKECKCIKTHEITELVETPFGGVYDAE